MKNLIHMFFYNNLIDKNVEVAILPKIKNYNFGRIFLFCKRSFFRYFSKYLNGITWSLLYSCKGCTSINVSTGPGIEVANV